MTARGLRATLSSYLSCAFRIVLDGVDTIRFAHQHMLCGTVANKLVGTGRKAKKKSDVRVVRLLST